MSVPQNHHQMDGMHQQHLRPPEVEHQQHQMYPQQEQYYAHYDHHYAPMHAQGDANQQWYGPYQDYQQQQQQQPQQQQQQYQYRMPQEQYHHHQMYDQQMPMGHHHQPHLQQPQHHHNQQVHPAVVEHKSWPSNEAQTQESHPSQKELSDEDSSAIGSSPTAKKKSLTSSPSKKLKKKVKVKSSSSAGSASKTASKAVKMGKVLSISKKKDKKSTLTKEELAKYPDESLREVVLKMKNGCDCPENCYKAFQPEMVYKHRLDIQDLTKNAHDMYLMGMTMACIGIPTERHDGKERKKQRAKYRFWGKEVCVNAFLYLENTTFYQIKSLRKHMMKHGVSPRSHGNLGRIPHNTFSLDNYQFATRFLHAYFEKHAIKDKRQKQGIIKLPKNITFKTIHDAYQAYGAEVNEPSIRIMSYSTFRGFLREQFPNLKLETGGSVTTPAKQPATNSTPGKNTEEA